MKERPILFSGPMVRAILEGRKSMTRRVCKIKLPEGIEYEPDPEDRDGISWSAVLGANDRWGKLNWLIGAKWGSQPLPKRHEHLLPPCFCPYGVKGDRLWVRECWGTDGALNESVVYRADGENQTVLRWRPSIHMPRWASRITLEITGVRAERLNEISEQDAVAEGVIDDGRPGIVYPNGAPSIVNAFWRLWNSLNEGRGYGLDKNPWVWVVEFRRFEK